MLELRDWNDSIIDSILRKAPPNVSRRWFVAAKRRGKDLSETAAGPWSGLCSLLVAEHDHIMRLFHTRKWTEPTRKEERAIIEILGILSLGLGGVRIGDQVLFVPSRFFKPKKERAVFTLNKPSKTRPKLKLNLRRP